MRRIEQSNKSNPDKADTCFLTGLCRCVYHLYVLEKQVCEQGAALPAALHTPGHDAEENGASGGESV